MQIPQQSPEEEQRQASQPLYEFVADSPSPASPLGEEPDVTEPASSASEPQASSDVPSAQSSGAQAPLTDPGRSPAPPPSAEAIRQGLVYPPPPSFYQNAQEDRAAASPPSLSHEAATLPSPAGPSLTSPGMSLATEYIPPPAFVPFPPPGIRPPGPPAFPTPQSRKWLWIVIAMLAGVLLLSCGLCTWAGYLVIAPTVQDQTNALSLANDYYAAIQSGNYTEAYSYLSPKGTISGLTREQFLQRAASRDVQYGPVRSYVPGQPSLSSNSNGNAPTSLDFSRLTITVNVTRPRLNYTVLLSLEKVGNNGDGGGAWKIVDLDGI